MKTAKTKHREEEANSSSTTPQSRRVSARSSSPVRVSWGPSSASRLRRRFRMTTRHQQTSVSPTLTLIVAFFSAVCGWLRSVHSRRADTSMRTELTTRAALFRAVLARLSRRSRYCGRMPFRSTTTLATFRGPPTFFCRWCAANWRRRRLLPLVGGRCRLRRLRGGGLERRQRRRDRSRWRARRRIYSVRRIPCSCSAALPPLRRAATLGAILLKYVVPYPPGDDAENARMRRRSDVQFRCRA